MPGEPTTIYSAANTQQAHLLRSLLEDRGITAWVVNDSIQFAGGDLPIGWTAVVHVVVSSSDAEAAREFALDFDLKTAHEPAPDNDKEPPPAEWANWPTCPQCQERRSAHCPICGASGTRFPLADTLQTEGGERVLLYCAGCDDHMSPEWHRLCPRCGHDFGDGLDLNRPPAGWTLDARSWLVIAGLSAGLAIFVAYCVWLFSR
jgi:hypothetical protein